jgi:Arc/MetJ family transcription regulator
MRTTIDIPEELLNEAMRLLKKRTKTEVIKEALRILIQREKIGMIKGFRGKIDLDIDMEALRRR